MRAPSHVERPSSVDAKSEGQLDGQPSFMDNYSKVCSMLESMDLEGWQITQALRIKR